MAQIIKHRRGSLESLSTVTGSLQKGEIVIASGSTNLTASNGNAIAFIVPQDGTVQATNRIIRGTTAPNTFPASTYNGMLNGVPYYASSSTQLPTLFLLGSGANEAIDLVGNIQPFSASVATSINALSASIGSGTIGNSVNALNTFSGAVLTQLSTIGTVTASYDSRFTEIGVVSGSLISSASAASVSNANLNTFSASANTRFTEIGVVSGSLISSASNAVVSLGTLNSYSSSLKTAFTASGRDVTFSNDVTIPGNLTVRGTQTIVDSTTVQIGDNIIELNGSGVTNGGIQVKDATAPNTATGSLLWDTTTDYWIAGVKNSESKILLAGGDSVVSGSSQITLQSTTGFTAFNSALSTITGSLISSASAAAIANSNQNTFTASAQVSIDALNSYTSSNTSTTALNAFTASAETRFTEIGVVSGSLIASASADRVSITNLNSFSSSQLTKDSTLATYTASVDTRFTEIGVVSGSLITSASAAKSTNDTQDGRLSNLETTSASVNTSVSNLNTFSSSVNTKLTEIGVVSGSLIASASSQNSRITVLEGTGTKQGVGTTNDVTFNSVTTTANVTIGGDLVVQGNTVTLNTATLVVEDKLITLASGSTNAAAANGAGIEVAGATATITYQSTPDAWQFNKPITGSAVTASLNVPSGGGNSKRIAFRDTNDNINFVTAPTTAGDLLQYDGSNFVMSNTIDGGSF
jgi:hypothetical protein